MLVRLIVLFCVVALVPSPAPVAASETPWGLSTFLDHRSKLGEVEATFVQEKQLPEVEAPIVSTGKLKFAPPDFLQMSVETPTSEIFTIDGTRASSQKAGSDRVRSFPVRFAPPLEAIGIGLRGTLGGNLGLMEEKFTVEFSGEKQDWRMLLTPNNRRMKRRIEKIELRGQDYTLQTFTMNEADGTITKMSITELL